jgi:hypothetical protein
MNGLRLKSIFHINSVRLLQVHGGSFFVIEAEKGGAAGKTSSRGGLIDENDGGVEKKSNRRGLFDEKGGATGKSVK